MKKIIAVVLACLFAHSLVGQQPSIIPKPVSVQSLQGVFTLTPDTKIVIPKGNVELQGIAQLLSERIGTSMGKAPEITNQSISGKHLYFEHKASLAPEAYELVVNPFKITLTASQPKGHFYAMQTLLQLMPTSVFGPSVLNAKVKWTIPSYKITDEPRFSYRGGMLDVGRHFFNTDFIKKYIDLLALHKLNTFHWHLTEDQGWRIEIKRYPKLTEVGAWRKETIMSHEPSNFDKGDGKRYGGFYTQEQIKDIVAYAKARYVTIIPEIEMPGHAMAALAAYPELGCTGGPYEVATHWGVFDDVYCPTEKTFEFLQNVLTEVIDLFPGTYIHIGGDECPKKSWEKSEFCQNLMKKEGLKNEHELQSYFIRRIDKFLTSKGRKMIGWDEILEGGISPNATIMSWRGMDGGIAAAQQGHDAIMTPTTNCYLDYYQADPENEPKAIGGYLPLEKVYEFDPIPVELKPEQRKHILGTQGNLWTEYINTTQQAEYMLYPRLAALAEVGWTPVEKKNFTDFSKRLIPHFERLNLLGVNFAKQLQEVKMQTGVYTRGEPMVKLSTNDGKGYIRYTIDGTQPTANSTLYSDTKGILLTGNTTVMAAVFNEKGEQLSKSASRYFNINKATGRPYVLANQPRSYTGGEKYGLTNGVRGVEHTFAAWVGFPGSDLDATFDYGRKINFSGVSIGFLHSGGDWIAAPRWVEVLGSDDGKTFTSLQKIEVTNEFAKERSVRQLNLTLPPNTNVRYIKVVAKNYGVLPPTHAGAGQPSWLFVDEIGIY